MAGCKQGSYGRGSYDEFLRIGLGTRAAAFEQRTFPTHEDVVAVKPAAETADGGATFFFAHRLACGVLPVPTDSTDVVTPTRQSGSPLWWRKK